MTIKEAVEALKPIVNHCRKTDSCEGCPLNDVLCEGSCINPFDLGEFSELFKED